MSHGGKKGGGERLLICSGIITLRLSASSVDGYMRRARTGPGPNRTVHLLACFSNALSRIRPMGNLVERKARQRLFSNLARDIACSIGTLALIHACIRRNSMATLVRAEPQPEKQTRGVFFFFFMYFYFDRLLRLTKFTCIAPTSIILFVRYRRSCFAWFRKKIPLAE